MSPASLALLPLESHEQQLWFQWTEYVRLSPGNHLLREHCWAVPNGGSRNRIEAARMQAQGVTAGVLDITIPIPSGEYHGLFIEMKRLGEKGTDKQLERVARLRTMGNQALVCQGFDEARHATVAYLVQSWQITDRWIG